jgi:O-antigen/teichoic acid export membrane protein
MDLKKATVFLTINKLYGALLMFIGRSMVARILGPELMGAFSSSIASVTVLSRFFSFGLGPSAQFNSGHGKYNKSDVFISVFLISCILSISTGIIIYLLDDLFLKVLFNGNISAFRYFQKFLIFFPFLFITLGLAMYLLGSDYHREYNRVNNWPSMLFILVIGLGWIFNINDFVLVDTAQIVFWVSGGLIALYFSYMSIEKIKLPSKTVIIKIVTYGGRAALVSSITYALNRIALLSGNHFVSGYELGLYAVAVTLGESIIQFYGMAGMVLMIRVSRATSLEEASRATVLACRVTLIILAIISIILGLLSPFLISILFGKEYLQSSTILMILLPGYLAMTQYKLFENFFYGRNKQQFAIIPYLAMTLTICISLPIFSHYFQAIGLAISTSLGQLVTLLVYMIMMKNVGKVKLKDLWRLKLSDVKYIIKIVKSFFKGSKNGIKG